MIQSYRDLLQHLDEADQPYHTLTLQYTFILYLVLGQLALLLLWRLGARRGPVQGSRVRRAAFALYLLVGQVALLFAWPPLVSAWLSADRALLADIVVTFHLGLILLVLLGLVLILVGWPLGWRWTRNFWLRLAQLLVIEIVAGQAVVGIECPLKTAERELRGGAGKLHELEGASALGAWCNAMLYYPDPKYVEGMTIRAANVVGSRSGNVLTTVVVLDCATEAPIEGVGLFFRNIYVAVGLVALLTWVLVPPRLPWEGKRDPHLAGPSAPPGL